MDCRTFARTLEDYLEGGLDFPARFAMERHAKQCFSCDKSLTTALTLRQMAHNLARVGAPNGFEHKLLARIREEKSHSRSGRLRDWWLYGMNGIPWRAASVTALVTVLVVGSITYIHFGASRRTEPPQNSASIATAKSVGSLEAARIALSQMGIPDYDLVKFDGIGRNKWAVPYTDPADGDFVEVPVPVSGDLQLILKLPRTIRMRYVQPSREYFIRTMSH